MGRARKIHWKPKSLGRSSRRGAGARMAALKRRVAFAAFRRPRRGMPVAEACRRGGRRSRSRSMAVLSGEEVQVRLVEDAALHLREVAEQQHQPHREVGDVRQRDDERARRRSRPARSCLSTATGSACARARRRRRPASYVFVRQRRVLDRSRRRRCGSAAGRARPTRGWARRRRSSGRCPARSCPRMPCAAPTSRIGLRRSSRTSLEICWWLLLGSR